MTFATLSDGTSSVALPDGLGWADELAWLPVVQTVEYSLTGALLIQAAARTAGRPITIEPLGDNAGLITRAQFDQLAAWADVPGQELTLTMRGADWTVMWRHQDGPALEAQPLWPGETEQPGDLLSVVAIKLMRV